MAHRSQAYAQELEMLLEEKERMISILQRGVLGAPQSIHDQSDQPSSKEWRQKYDAIEVELSNSQEKLRQKDIYI